MKKIDNWILVASFFFFIASTFISLDTIKLDSKSKLIDQTENIVPCNCCTCDFGSSGPSGSCKEAIFCGTDGICSDGSPCNMSGGLCGECAEPVEN